MNILYIILKHVIWRFQIYNLFREIFKFREDKSNNVFREIRKSAKFEFCVCQTVQAETGKNVSSFQLSVKTRPILYTIYLQPAWELNNYLGKLYNLYFSCMAEHVDVS